MTKDEALKLALEAYLCREMPAGTVIGDPKWWAPKIANVIKEVLAQPAQESARGAFERFVCNKWDSLGTGIVGRKADGKYIATHVETMWETWQAALAQPAQHYESGWNSALEMAAHQLENNFKRAFGDDTLKSIAVYIKGLKK